MATVTKGRTFVSGEIITPAKLNDVVDLATVTDIQTADIADEQVTPAKLGPAVQQALVPTGAVLPFVALSLPAGWLVADGAAVSRSTYANLFSLIGTGYGVGNGSTTFNLPDLRGYFIRGIGENADGTISGTFGQKQPDALKSHTHSGSTATAGDHNHGIGGSVVVGGGSGVGGSGTGQISLQATAVAGAHSHAVTINATGDTETRPANIALLYCIKF